MSSKNEVADCFRLAVRGGPTKERFRGLTLQLETSHHDRILNTLTNIDVLIESQRSLVERAMSLYGANSRGLAEETEMLNTLTKLKNECGQLSKKEIAHKALDILIKFD